MDNHGKIVEKSMKNHGTIMGKSSNNHGVLAHGVVDNVIHDPATCNIMGNRRLLIMGFLLMRYLTM